MGLYAPYGVLLLLAVAWTIGWFYMRHRVTAGLDAWLASEARRGREWTCPDRAVGGYPFVGTPDKIADELATLSQAGVRGIGVSFVNYLHEAPYFCAEVLPRLERAGVRAKT